MKDLPQRPQPPQPPQPLCTVPRVLRLGQVGDAEPREAPDGGTRHLLRARSVRRRLFFDDDSAGEEGSAGGGGSSSDAAPRRRRRARSLFGDLYEPLFEGFAEKFAASRRWNFDFENERPLEGQWQWEKVEDAGSAANENGDPQQPEPVDESRPSPQR